MWLENGSHPPKSPKSAKANRRQGGFSFKPNIYQMGGEGKNADKEQ